MMNDAMTNDSGIAGRFAGKYAVVTGGARGISYASAERMAVEGLAGVILADLNGEQAEQSASALDERYGCKAYGIKVDVAKPHSVEALFARTGELFPRLDILVNGAGACPTTPIEDLDADQWDWCMNINLRGAHLCVREAITTMKPQRSGAIVNIASLAARIGGIASSVSYAASKGGLLTATRSYAKLLGQYGIRVNAVCPGVINTAMTAGTGYTAAGIPLGRLGETDDVAGVIAFLASDDACYITGQGIDVNGGVYMN
ncbi:3-oxoacyl-ACP reductase [Bifidobacterium ramosum]|uniref:3-oxoacyl-ACP reductase n=2 Tax=Bifidobacterium ramosum TaxID=1798158 RepID=A0A6L4WXW2_9BIFI|nr:SDR family NAD(P)-dependent oxidoreductase [Bifidobacterium ramosum]KAB8286806.1 3-oxoacyl-ACP reductase [Bifidobacterium ramosum]